MKAVRALIASIVLAFAAPACFVHGTADDGSTESVMVAYRTQPRCSANRYWNGRRCAKKRWVHAHHYHRHHYIHVR